MNINNGVESTIDINDIKSGSYLIAANSVIINNKGIQSNVSESEIIIIQK